MYRCDFSFFISVFLFLFLSFDLGSFLMMGEVTDKGEECRDDIDTCRESLDLVVVIFIRDLRTPHPVHVRGSDSSG